MIMIIAIICIFFYLCDISWTVENYFEKQWAFWERPGYTNVQQSPQFPYCIRL